MSWELVEATDVPASRPEQLNISENTAIDALTSYAINQHALAMKAGRELLFHSVQCGRALNELRDRHRSGTWYEWCLENLGIKYRLCRDYMFLARNVHIIEEVKPENKNQALKAIESHPSKTLAESIPYLRSEPLTADELAEAKRLRSGGMSWERLGDHFDRSYRSVQRQLDPSAAQRFNANRRRANKLAAEARRIEKAKEKERLISASSMSTAYGLIRKAMLEVDQLGAAAGTTYKHLVDAEAAIVRAIRAERRTL